MPQSSHLPCGAVPEEERYARAIGAWQNAEELAHGAERLASHYQEAARVAWARARERRRRAADAFAARQVAFAHGLAEAAAAHERAAIEAERRAAEAERRARPLRLDAESRLEEIGRILRARAEHDHGGLTKRGAA